MRTKKPSPTRAAAAFAAPPSNRASWTGRMQLDVLSVPVKAYPATVTSSGPLCQLHAGCGQRILRHQTVAAKQTVTAAGYAMHRDRGTKVVGDPRLLLL